MGGRNDGQVDVPWCGLSKVASAISRSKMLFANFESRAVVDATYFSDSPQ